MCESGNISSAVFLSLYTCMLVCVAVLVYDWSMFTAILICYVVTLTDVHTLARAICS